LDLNEQECSADGKLKSTPIVNESSPSTGPTYPAMGTSETFTAPTLSPSISSVAGFPASLFPMRGEDWAREMTASSGRKCFDSYVRLSRPTSWVRTFLASLLTTRDFYSPLSSLTWRLRGSRSRRLLYFRLVPSVPYIEGIGSGFVPTPDTTTGAPNKGSNKRNGPKSLTEYALLPTPTVSMFKGASVGALTRKDGRSRSNDRLDYAVLTQQLYPTLTTRDSSGRQYTRDHGEKGKERLALPGVVGGQLNPPWVEWLMGFPEGWTDLKPSETPSSPRSQNS
jgi:hypothetical protein